MTTHQLFQTPATARCVHHRDEFTFVAAHSRWVRTSTNCKVGCLSLFLTKFVGFGLVAKIEERHSASVHVRNSKKISS